MHAFRSYDFQDCVCVFVCVCQHRFKRLKVIEEKNRRHFMQHMVQTQVRERERERERESKV